MNLIYKTTLLFLVVAPTIMGMEQSAEKPMHKSTFLHNFVNGAVAGGAEVLISNPLIVLKNELILRSKSTTQQPPGNSTQSNGSQSNDSRERLKQTNTSTHRLSELFRKYYKGCGTGILFMAPIVAVQNSAALILAEQFKGESSANDLQRAAAAFCAGSLSSMIESPADLVVLQRQNPAFKQESYEQTWHRIAKYNGLPTFYRGIAATCVRDGTITIAFKGGGEALRNHLPFTTGNKIVDKTLSDVCAALLAVVASQPADVVSSHMKSDLGKKVYKNCLQTLYTIVNKEGFRALFKGLIPRSTRAVLAVPLWCALTEQEVGTRSLTQLEKLFKS